MRIPQLALSIAFAAALLIGSLGSLPATTAHAADDARSNMGLCSSYLGQMDGNFGPNARAEVNHIIQDMGEVLGIGSPGELFRIRAQQHINGTPEQECLQRPQP